MAYTKKEAVKFGWEKVTQNLKFFIFVSLTVLFVNSLPNISESILGQSLILSVVFFLLKTFIDLGVIKISLSFVDGVKAVYTDLFACAPYYLKYLAALLIFIVIVFVGMLLLIVPGIYFGVRLMFFGALVLDKGLGPIDALKKSWEITKGKVWDLFLLTLIILGINLLGMLALLVGLIITLPLTSIAMFYVYRKIISETPKSA